MVPTKKGFFIKSLDLLTSIGVADWSNWSSGPVSLSNNYICCVVVAQSNSVEANKVMQGIVSIRRIFKP